MRRPSRRSGVALSSVVVAIAAVLVAPVAPAAATPAPAPTLAPTAPTRVTPTPGPSRRLCGPATAGSVTCFAEQRTDVTPASTAAAPRGYGPADLRSAYSIPTTGGAGVTVATVVAYDHPTAAADLAAYRTQFGLPALTAGQFQKVNQRGATSPLPKYDAGWAGEAALDVQMITATCPSCRILLVEADSPSLGAIATAVQTATRLGATFVSNSYGAEDDATTPLAASYATPGVTYVASTGDEGYSGRVSPVFPATAPGVLAVGGTSLRPSGSARGWSETAWSGAGHGTACSTTYPRPAAQTGVATGCAGRAVADVSAVADPNTGVAVYNSSGGGWRVYGGTSAAAPIVAGIAAVADQPGHPVDVAYANPGAFHDVTAGATSTCPGGVLCAAGTGWDGPTGLGTPAGTGGLATGDLSCGGTPAPTSGGVSGGASAGRYVALAPVRVLDTRSAVGGAFGPAASRTLGLGTSLPGGSAAAVVVNLTVTNATGSGFVTAWPAGAARPVASNLNTTPGLTRANEVTVALGSATTGGAPNALSLFNSAGSADLVVDLLGYYTVAGDAAAARTYHPAATPTRAVDTRTATGPLGNSGRRSRVCVTVSQPGADGSPLTGIGAVAVTLTAVSPDGPGYLKAWNGDAATEPLVSSLNFDGGQTVPNAAVVPVSCLDAACSQVSFAVANRVSAETQVLVDVVGVYASDPDGGLVLSPRSPQRVVDTRTNTGFGPLGASGVGAVTVPGATGAGAVAANVTAVGPTVGTFLTVFGSSRPPTSNLNPVAGEVVPAEVVSGLGAGGVLRVFNLGGRVDVVVDVAGVFVPPAA